MSYGQRARSLREGQSDVENEFGDFSPIFVFVSYAAVWIAFFAYLYYVARRQSDIRSQIDALKESAENEEGSEGSDQSDSGN